MKRILSSIKILIVVIVALSCTGIYLPHQETKMSNNNLNKTLDLDAMAIKYEEICRNDLYAPLDIYNGTLTGYVADCPLCSGRLGCNGQNVLDRTTTYQDNDYGLVRIVASSSNLECGSIIEFSEEAISNEKITAIVLDRGVLGTAIDLLVESTDTAYQIGRRDITYNVLRYGYNR